MKIAEPAEIDINKDGEYDMEIKAWYIGDDQASIYIKSDSIGDLSKKGQNKAFQPKRLGKIPRHKIQ